MPISPWTRNSSLDLFSRLPGLKLGSQHFPRSTSRRTKEDLAVKPLTASSLAFCIAPAAGSQLWRSSLRAQDFPDFAVDSGRLLGCFVDQVEPLTIVVVKLRLPQKVGGLHDGLDGIAEVVGQGTQF